MPNYKIILRDRQLTELIIDLEKEEMEKIWQALQKKEVKTIKLGDRIINTAFIMLIEPIGEEAIPERFKLPEPTFERISVAEEMEKIFNLLKAKGLFKNYPSYQAWHKEKEKKH